MQSSQRQSNLASLIRARGFARLNELAETTQVSESTIRRDLIALEERGVVRRTHGGVVSISAPYIKSDETRRAKQDIASLAVKLIEDGDTILLDGGTTTFEIARKLAGRKIQVITNAIPVAELLSTDENVNLVMLGGYVYPRSQVAIGPLTAGMLQQLNCRRAFLSAAGINEKGLFNSNLLTVETEQAMMRCADTVTVVADSTKFGRQSTIKLCSLDEIDEMIVDAAVTQDWAKILKANSIDLKIAETAESKTNDDK